MTERAMIQEVPISGGQAALGAEPVRAEPTPRFMTLGTSLPVVAVTLAAVAKTLAAGTLAPASAALFVVLAALHALLGTVGFYFVERRDRRDALYLHFAVASAVAWAALVLSRGHGDLLVFSLISQGVVYLPLAGTVLVTTLFTGTTCVLFATDGRWSSELIGVVSGVAFVLVFSQLLVRERRTRAEGERLAAELADANQRLRDHASDVEELAAAKERNRIAREIHDGIGHYLTVVHVQLEAAQATLGRDPAKAQHALGRAQELTREGLAEVRRSVAVLREAAPGAAPAALIVALEKLADECTSDGLVAELEVSGQPRALSASISSTLYRAVQEALTNVRRHAQASRVRIGLVFREPGLVWLWIEDDGVGAAQAGPGFGLLGLRERAELCGGRFTIASSPGRGFRLELELPA